jgi:hypothetical protein
LPELRLVNSVDQRKSRHHRKQRGGINGTQTDSSLVSIKVLSVTPMRAGKLFALASVEIDIDGSPFTVSAR